MRFSWGQPARLLALAVVLTVVGCSASESTPRTSLSEEQKQQLQELDEQRQDEWGIKKEGK
jgi:hypothetical protein